MGNIVDQQLIKVLIDTKKVGLLGREICKAFDTYVSALPWRLSGTGLDWKKIPYFTSIAIEDVGSEGILSFIKKTTLGKYKAIGIIYAYNEPGIVCDLDFLISGLDELVYHAPGAVYVVGLECENNNLQIVVQDFVEIVDGRFINGVLKQE